MVRHHILVGLGFKRQNFRNRAMHFMMQNKKGSGMYNWRDGTVPLNQMTLAVEPSRSLPKISRQPLKFNY
jgi:hypothetical protein